MKTIGEVNSLSEEAFVREFGDVAEHSPWVARGAVYARPFKDREAMVAAFEKALRAASEAAQLTLIRLHPDLAGKAKLTGSSSREQKGAGLDALTAEEFARFTEMNETYKARFGFPFIFAVKGASKHQILASFEERIGKTREAEFETALTQVMRIFRFRIEDRVQP
jgi:2-oxo-4-hydroxy-4-carboxy-5-ureidoimidazoline decarboxylase